MLDEYIKELIANNNRVIIPNFGAFLLRATSKNKNKKDLSEKIDDIYFSPFLKFNDELLVNHIIKTEGGDTQGAMDKINGYIKNIEEKVEKEGAYTIGGLGEFHMDDQGKIQFKVFSSAEAGEQAKAPQAPPRKESAPSSKTVNEKAAREQKTPRGEEQASNKPAGSQTGNKQTQAKASQTTSTTDSSKGKTSGAKTPPPPPSASKQAAKKQGKGTNRGLVLSIAIGVPIAVIFIWAMLNFDTVQDLFRNDNGPTNQAKTAREEPVKPKKEKSESQQTTQKQETADASKQQKASEETAKQSETQREVRQQPGSPANEKKYYIVAGSFKKRENAVSFREKLVEQGYNAEMIGERNGMHAVSYASFQNKNQAQAELRKLRNQDGLSAWLLYY
jgi:nucleoid DNA-binding protein